MNIARRKDTTKTLVSSNMEHQTNIRSCKRKWGKNAASRGSSKNINVVLAVGTLSKLNEVVETNSTLADLSNKKYLKYLLEQYQIP